jgi:glutathione S-transferase
MTRRRRRYLALFVVLAPLFVAGFDLGMPAALLLLLVILVGYWLIVLSGIVAPERGAAIELDTIPPSHFVEKVRWALDRLGVEYTEKTAGGTLGVFFTGRTVPRLRVRTGAVESVIGNSPEILRYLWGVYGVDRGDRAAFLAPTTARLQFERDLDRYARNLQVWIYGHILGDRDLTLHAWGADSGAVPAWQRMALRLLFPLLALLVRRAFRLDAQHHARAVVRIEELLGQVETRLADGRKSILGGDDINYTDLSFAAFCGLWMQPPNFGGGRADESRIEHQRMPAGMRADVERWREDFPKVAEFVDVLYANERLPAPGAE